eukprot:GHVT01064953.1.p6 GENE.GHVT01064953.1~~GHVT01064953.1.p6  ORF type:complete len:100 (-),score=23.14 GHVT01064953.1:1125-1424(-)
MTDGDVRQVAPTLGFNIETRTYKSFQLNLWDVGGQKTIRSFWRNYFEQTDGLVWVVDAADRRRMDDCKEELLALLKEEVALRDVPNRSPSQKVRVLRNE